MATNYQPPSARSESPTNTIGRNDDTADAGNTTNSAADDSLDNTTGAQAPTAAPTPAPAAATVPSIGPTFKDVNGTELQFKLKPTTRLDKAMKAYAERTARNVDTLRFYFEGDRVVGDDTAETKDMNNGDQVDVFIEQIGGCGGVVVLA